MRSSTNTLIKALEILSKDIVSEDGIANVAIMEASERLKEESEILDFIFENCEIKQQIPWSDTYKHSMSSREDVLDEMKIQPNNEKI